MIRSAHEEKDMLSSANNELEERETPEGDLDSCDDHHTLKETATDHEKTKVDTENPGQDCERVGETHQDYLFWS